MPVLTPQQQIEERGTIEAAQKGDTAAFEKLYVRYHREVFLYLMSVLRQPHAAEDVCQDVFIKVFCQISSYRQQSPFHHWLFRMARNAAIDRMRRDKVRRVTSLDQEPVEGHSLLERLPSSASTPEQENDQARRAGVVRDAVAELPERFREVVVMREWQDLPYEAIADQLGISEGTVKSRLFRARQILAERLAKVLGT
jgi:RNA polymerase sigma-70 factor (ECF subfamily)